MAKDIFISYSRRDQATAFKLARALEDKGYSVWMDQERIDGATLWQKEIVDAIGSCRMLILLASGSSFGSDNVVRETSLAFEEKKPILPIFLEDTQIPSEFRYQLTGIHRIELFQDDRKHWDSVLNAVQRLMQTAAARRGVRGPAVARPAPMAEPEPSRWGKKIAVGVALLILLLAGVGLLRHKAKTSRPVAAKQEAAVTPAHPKPAPVVPAPQAKNKPRPEPSQKGADSPPPEPEPQPAPKQPPEPVFEPSVVATPAITKSRVLVGRYHNRKDFFRGTIGFRENGTAELKARGLKTGTECAGEAVTTEKPPPRKCAGLHARVNLKCGDGAVLTGELVAQNCNRGIIHARDSQGGELTFRYGLSRSDLQKLMARQLQR